MSSVIQIMILVKHNQHHQITFTLSLYGCSPLSFSSQTKSKVKGQEPN